MAHVFIEREENIERWQAALRRALREGVEVRQLAGCGMWIATSGSDGDTAYEVTPWGCECHAAQYGDPVCKHRAALLAKLGRLAIEHTPAPSIACPTCNGLGEHPGTVSLGTTWRYDNVTCEDCHGSGRIPAGRAA